MKTLTEGIRVYYEVTALIWYVSLRSSWDQNLIGYQTLKLGFNWPHEPQGSEGETECIV